MQFFNLILFRNNEKKKGRKGKYIVCQQGLVFRFIDLTLFEMANRNTKSLCYLILLTGNNI